MQLSTANEEEEAWYGWYFPQDSRRHTHKNVLYQNKNNLHYWTTAFQQKHLRCACVHPELDSQTLLVLLLKTWNIYIYSKDSDIHSGPHRINITDLLELKLGSFVPPHFSCECWAGTPLCPCKPAKAHLPFFINPYLGTVPASGWKIFKALLRSIVTIHAFGDCPEIWSTRTKGTEMMDSRFEYLGIFTVICI